MEKKPEVYVTIHRRRWWIPGNVPSSKMVEDGQVNTLLQVKL